MSTIDVQNVFNKVIDSGIYTGNLMCLALKKAAVTNVITIDEYLVTKKTIENYLQGTVTLGVALDNSGLPSKSTDRMAVYKDWSNRPKLTR